MVVDHEFATARPGCDRIATVTADGGAVGRQAPAASADVEHTVQSFAFHTDAPGQLSAACGYRVAFTLDGSWSVVSFTDDAEAS